MALLSILLGAYGLAVMLWLFYLAVMALTPHLKNMHPVAKAHAYLLVALALALDFTFNVIIGTVLFLALPRDWLLSGRLTRYVQDESERPWRRAFARWVCQHLLDQFDPRGGHCR